MSKQHLTILQPSGRRGHVDEGTSLRKAARGERLLRLHPGARGRDCEAVKGN